VDKCIWVESLERAKDVAYAGATVKSAIIGTVIEDMKIHNCGYVEIPLPPCLFFSPSFSLCAPLSLSPPTAQKQFFSHL